MANLATFKQYQALMSDRPVKLLPEDADFRKDAGEGYPCAGCVHWFHNPITNSMVCEVLRPPDEIVPADFTCIFFTMDYETFPKLDDAQ